MKVLMPVTVRGRSVLAAALMSATAAVCRAGGVREISYPSAADRTRQPAMFYSPGGKEPVPLLVALHTWSGGYKQKLHAQCAEWCVRNGWAYIHPHFRGPNRRPQATGSDLVVKDILSAVEFARKATSVDGSRVYLVGTSGGGYTALLVAGRAPDVWAGVSAWVPISDLAAWYRQCKAAGRRYYRDIAKSCGGAPGDGADVDREYRKRSPLTHLGAAAGLALDINAGIDDGHKGSVPVSHSLRAFNRVAAEKDRIPEKDIRYLVAKAEVPPHLKEPLEDPTYGRNSPLFRRTSGRARVTIFRGGHELVPLAAMKWLARQRKRPEAGRGKAVEERR
ncbi:MAG: alpha/beta hydrolase family protein [Planctomycetota bacterium]